MKPASTLLQYLIASALLSGGAAIAAPGIELSQDAETTLHWVLNSRDNGAAPFVVIDKRQARLWAYDATGRPLGNTAVLLGAAQGDDSVPGIGERPMAQIRPEERTTPAGRFVAESGHNANGEDIFWVDYDAAVSMHRVRPSHPKERRLERLASPTAADNRISYGCINVPAAFYDGVIRPSFGPTRGIVYLLPETRPLETLLSGSSSLRQTDRLVAW